MTSKCTGLQAKMSNTFNCCFKSQPILLNFEHLKLCQYVWLLSLALQHNSQHSYVVKWEVPHELKVEPIPIINPLPTIKSINSECGMQRFFFFKYKIRKTKHCISFFGEYSSQLNFQTRSIEISMLGFVTHILFLDTLLA